MPDDYLWDRSGPPDPEVQRLEGLLARFRDDRDNADLPTPRQTARPSSPALATIVAVAAIVVLALGVAWMGPVTRQAPREADHWTLLRVEGTPLLGRQPAREEAAVPVGTWLETDATSTVRLAVGSLGQMTVASDSRLRIVQAETGQHRVEMAWGTLDALIWAPPGQFVVSTPSATAVDLGCAYRLSTTADGHGSLHVTSGWVGLVHEGREAFIPAGASVGIRPSQGPGTPVFDTASPDLQSAVAAFDRASGDASAQAAPLEVILRLTRHDDALTLWHLLESVAPAYRGRVYDALAAMVPPPASVTRHGIEAGLRSMRDDWWAALGYGGVDWWRLWQREWQAGTSR